MSVTCPNGHVSQTEDFCDTCGAKIDRAAPPEAAAPPAPSEPASGPPPGGQTCPNCAAVSTPDSLFCEACGYDFTTGALPRGAAALPDREASKASATTGSTGAEAAPSGEAPAVGPVTGEAAAAGQPSAGTAGADPAPQEASAGAASGEAASGPASAAGAASGGASATAARPAGATGIPPGDVLEWVAEVWIDPEWYAVQEAEDPLPSPGLPAVVPLTTRSALVGRVSTSRNIRPDVDCTTDTGVSRRHAQLTTDGKRWFVEDLGSSNGTYIGAAGGPLPQDPIPVGPKRELQDDERIYVGAWTRIVVREATDEEKAAVAGRT